MFRQQNEHDYENKKKQITPSVMRRILNAKYWKQFLGTLYYTTLIVLSNSIDTNKVFTIFKYFKMTVYFSKYICK